MRYEFQNYNSLFYNIIGNFLYRQTLLVIHILKKIAIWCLIPSGKSLLYYIINFPFFWERHAMKKWKGTLRHEENIFWVTITEKWWQKKHLFTLLFGLWLVTIMLIFRRLCQIEIQPHILLVIICVVSGENCAHFHAIVSKHPHQMHFSRLVHFLFRIFFYLISESTP